MKQTLNSLIIVGKVAYVLGSLMVLNFFFGLLFFGFLTWLAVGGALFLLLILALFAGKKILFMPFQQKRPSRSNASSGGDVIDVEAEVVDDAGPGDPGNAVWHDPVYCPRCHSSDTRFVEPRHETGIYECNNCRARFEAEG
ncbi:MAG: hypothetical protein PHO30_06205 [Candidatus Omnitrophica bacterium]|nr:hypothetical protein [Candidatus Omnitrophota bacterium]